jgi:putative ABC transport system permease protein
MPLDVAIDQSHRLELITALAGSGGVLLCVLLCSASLFALMAVAVAGRTREMGIRIAIGASRPTVLSALFGRVLLQLGAGTLVGSALFVGMAVIVLTDGGPGIGHLTEYVSGPLLIVALVMMLVGLSACVVPARRALRIAPFEALRD